MKAASTGRSSNASRGARRQRLREDRRRRVCPRSTGAPPWAADVRALDGQEATQARLSLRPTQSGSGATAMAYHRRPPRRLSRRRRPNPDRRRHGNLPRSMARMLPSGLGARLGERYHHVPGAGAIEVITVLGKAADGSANHRVAQTRAARSTGIAILASASWIASGPRGCR